MQESVRLWDVKDSLLKLPSFLPSFQGSRVDKKGVGRSTTYRNGRSCERTLSLLFTILCTVSTLSLSCRFAHWLSRRMPSLITHSRLDGLAVVMSYCFLRGRDSEGFPEGECDDWAGF